MSIRIPEILVVDQINYDTDEQGRYKYSKYWGKIVNKNTLNISYESDFEIPEIPEAKKITDIC